MSSERIDQDLLGNPEPDLRPLTNEEKSQVDVNPDVVYAQDMIYLSSDFVGDTLSVWGCIGDYICDEVRFVIE